MIIKRLLASWNRICPGCNLARKYPQSFIGKMVRTHWEKGCPSHKAYVELYGQKDAKPKNAVNLSAKNKLGPTESQLRYPPRFTIGFPKSKR